MSLAVVEENVRALSERVEDDIEIAVAIKIGQGNAVASRSAQARPACSVMS
jgi:hypothetical protein